MRTLVLASIVLGAMALRATERYASQYQSLPMLDWLEAHPPFEEAGGVPSAADLAHGFVLAEPLLVIRDDVRPYVPQLGPPAVGQRTIGGVRDAARVQLRTLPEAPVPVTLAASVSVFHRAVRASSWASLLSHELDLRDPETGSHQLRVSDSVWLTQPGMNAEAGEATMLGVRGPVMYELRAQVAAAGGPTPPDYLDLSARAEAIARRVATGWTAWLDQQLAAGM
jgi:hypothetical protein